MLDAPYDYLYSRRDRRMGLWSDCRVSPPLIVVCYDASQKLILYSHIRGQAELFIDNEVVVSNVENQRPADTFFSNGSQEEIGRRHLQAGNKYELRMEWSNFKKVNPKGQ